MGVKVPVTIAMVIRRSAQDTAGILQATIARARIKLSEGPRTRDCQAAEGLCKDQSPRLRLVTVTDAG